MDDSLKDTRPSLPPLEGSELFEGGAAVEEKPSFGRALIRFFVEAFETLVLALILFVTINTVSARIRVDGRSMEPSFHHGEYVIVNKLAYRFGEVERGDVIVFPSPVTQGEDLIKRVIGLPGDRIEVHGGRVFVNGQALDEPYVMGPTSRDQPETEVPVGMVFVMGDNRNDSSDSRSWGPLPIGDILGQAVFVYWPLADFGSVTDVESVFAGQ